MTRLDEIRARLAAVDRAREVVGSTDVGLRAQAYDVLGRAVRERDHHILGDIAFLLAEVERLTGERDEAVAALKDVGGPLCECGHEGDLYHYTDGGRECTVRDCACVGLRWSKR